MLVSKVISRCSFSLSPSPPHAHVTEDADDFVVIVLSVTVTRHMKKTESLERELQS